MCVCVWGGDAVTHYFLFLVSFFAVAFGRLHSVGGCLAF